MPPLWCASERKPKLSAPDALRVTARELRQHFFLQPQVPRQRIPIGVLTSNGRKRVDAIPHSTRFKSSSKGIATQLGPFEVVGTTKTAGPAADFPVPLKPRGLGRRLCRQLVLQLAGQHRGERNEACHHELGHGPDMSGPRSICCAKRCSGLQKHQITRTVLKAKVDFPCCVCLIEPHLATAPNRVFLSAALTSSNWPIPGKQT